MKPTHHSLLMHISSDGTTASEKYLGKLARKAFLNFWSYSNPYTDESKGSELCDFMVVFGNDIIIFSDKHCNFPKVDDINIAWNRWYKNAIKKSARQLAGAASFIERHSNRIYLDSACEHPLPVPLPPSDKRRIHLIAVTRGSAEAAKKFWDTFGSNSSSSLVLDTAIKDREHKDRPFMVGWPLKNKQFIHIFDELTLDIILNELDTAPDFINYLRKKEEYLTQDGIEFIICGEEELLAAYLKNPKNFDDFSFPIVPKNIQNALLEEGEWQNFSRSAEYFQWKKSMEISYKWDNLIEHQTKHIQKGTANVQYKPEGYLQDVHAHEFMLRAMADESRINRKYIAESLEYILTKNFSGRWLFRTLVIPSRPSRAYVLMAFKHSPDMNEADYRLQRKEYLVGHCIASRLRINGITEVIGIGSDQKELSSTSQDFSFMQFSELISQEEKESELSRLRAAGIWQDNWKCI